MGPLETGYSSVLHYVQVRVEERYRQYPPPGRKGHHTTCKDLGGAILKLYSRPHGTRGSFNYNYSSNFDETKGNNNLRETHLHPIGFLYIPIKIFHMGFFLIFKEVINILQNICFWQNQTTLSNLCN